MKSRIKARCVLVVAPMLVIVNSIFADTPAFTLVAVSTNPLPPFTGTRAWQFEIGGAPMGFFVTQLGVFDAAADGLVNAHQVGLWRTDGTLLTSATVPAGTAAPLIGGFRWVSISWVFIPYALGDYRIGAQYSADDADLFATPSSPTRSFEVSPFPLAGYTGLGTDLPYPAWPTRGSCPECFGPKLWDANFQFVAAPEPSVWWLLAPGLLCLWAHHRQRH